MSALDMNTLAALLRCSHVMGYAFRLYRDLFF